MERNHKVLWIASFLFYVVGDILTTFIGLQNGATETNPVARLIIEESFWYIIPPKLTVIFLAFVGYYITSSNWKVIYPLVLTVFGFVLTLANIAVLFQIS